MAMLLLWIAVYCYLCISHVATDFDLHSPNGNNYEFVFHEKSNLLLTLHGTGCYFARLDPALKDRVLHGEILLLLQKQIEATIETTDSRQKYLSSVDVVSHQFSDVLADYRYREDQVFIVWLDYVACDFQAYQSLCGWRADLQDSLQWRLHKGATPTLLTGPDNDHTLDTQEGQYLYLEANEGREGEVAEIVSPVLQLTDALCLRFWYNMHGTHVGHLAVYTEHTEPEPDGTHNTTTVWQKSGNHGNVWRLAEVTVHAPVSTPTPGGKNPDTPGATVASVQVYLRATRGPGIHGDIAIDDISSLPGVCAPENLNCSFEVGEGLCLWSHGGSAVGMQWRIHTGATDTAETGPDSALQTVNDDNHAYLYLEGDDGGAGEVAELLSPSLFIPSPLCLRFWFHMKGSGVHSLAVLLRREGSNSETLLWQRLGPQYPTTWHQAHLTLPPDHPHTPHRVVIRAIRGLSVSGDIAIDLISLTSGACGETDSQTSAQSLVDG